MKKILMASAVFFMPFIICSQTMTITNILGGDSSQTGGSDFLTYTKSEDSDGKEYYSNAKECLISDRFQFDVSAEKFEGRARMEIKTGDKSGNSAAIRFRGFGTYYPVEYFGIGAGNSFFSRYMIQASYLTAADDVAANGRLLKSGFGGLGKIPFSENKRSYLRLACGLSGDSEIDSMKSLGLCAGFDLNLDKKFSLGASFQNITGEKFTAGVFAGINSVENLVLNLAYYHKFDETDFIYRSTLNAVGLSSSYYFRDAAFKTYFDFISGLSDEYYESEETKNYSDSGIPFTARIRLEQSIKKTFEISLDTRFDGTFNQSDNFRCILYPAVACRLPDRFGTVKAGVRLNFDKVSGNGLTSFSVPVSWKLKLDVSPKPKAEKF